MPPYRTNTVISSGRVRGYGDMESELVWKLKSYFNIKGKILFVYKNRRIVARFTFVHSQRNFFLRKKRYEITIECFVDVGSSRNCNHCGWNCPHSWLIGYMENILKKRNIVKITEVSSDPQAFTSEGRMVDQDSSLPRVELRPEDGDAAIAKI